MAAIASTQPEQQKLTWQARLMNGTFLPIDITPTPGTYPADREPHVVTEAFLKTILARLENVTVRIYRHPGAKTACIA